MRQAWFSYEVQSGFGGKTYLDQLKKAVHPAGFAVFAKVKTATSVSVKVTDAGSSLGGGYYSGLGVPDPDEKFSPILMARLILRQSHRKPIGQDLTLLPLLFLESEDL